MISRDKKVLDETSAAFARMQEYRQLFEELHIVVMKGNVFSFLKAFISAAKLAKKVGRGSWITSQDPFESGIVAFFIAKLLGLKLQLQLHTDVFSYFYHRHSIRNFFRTFMARLLIPRADSLRVVSEKIKDEIIGRKLLPVEKIFVLPVYVDVQSIVAKPSTYDLRVKYQECEKIIIVVARLEREKNIRLSIEAFRKILRKYPKAGLVIVGDGKEKPRLQKLAEHLGIAGNVRFEGWLTDTTSAYKSADLLLVTSLYEGYGMNIVEALACGCPVVSTDVGIASEAGAVIVNYDPGDIALKAEAILADSLKGGLSQSFKGFTKQEYLDKYKVTFSI